MTVTEAAGKVVDALKDNPLCLSLLVVIIVVGGLETYRNVEATRERNKMISALLDRCVMPDRSERDKP